MKLDELLQKDNRENLPKSMLLKLRYRNNEVEHQQVTRKQAQYRKGVYCNAWLYVALS